MTEFGAEPFTRLTNLREKHNREEWIREVELSQRNTVFPDTVRNEVDFWRKLVSGQRLSNVQAIGLWILAATVLAILFLIAKDMVSHPRQSIVFIVLATLVFLVLRWRIRKALQEAHPEK